MASQPILNPELPLVHEIEGGLVPGKMVKVQGRVPENSNRFAINYQLGPGLNPRDDIAIHVSPRFNEGFVTRNHIESMNWGTEENSGPMWLQSGMPFEIIILCEYHCYKVAINGRHFVDFFHRLPYNRVTHLTIDGEVVIDSVFFETIPIGRPSAPVPDVSTVNVGPPPPGGLYPTLNPDEKYGPTPGAGGYGDQQPRVYYPEHKKSEEESAFGGCLDKVGLAVGGLVAAGGVAAAMHAYNKNKQKNHEEMDHEKTEAKENESGLGGLGALGAALASSLASNAMQGDKNTHAQQGYPTQDGGMLGSILGALGGGGSQSNYQQQPPMDPLGGALSSILGGVLGGGASHQQQPQYQPTGGYSQNQDSQNSGGGNDLLSGLGSALFKSAMDGLSKHSHRSHNNENNEGGGSYFSPPASSHPTYNETLYSSTQPNPSTTSGPKLSAAEISKGLGLGDDED